MKFNFKYLFIIPFILLVILLCKVTLVKSGTIVEPQSRSYLLSDVKFTSDIDLNGNDITNIGTNGSLLELLTDISTNIPDIKLDKRIPVIQEELSSISNNISDITGTISNIDNRVTDNRLDISSLIDIIETLNEVVSNLDYKVTLDRYLNGLDIEEDSLTNGIVEVDDYLPYDSVITNESNSLNYIFNDSEETNSTSRSLSNRRSKTTVIRIYSRKVNLGSSDYCKLLDLDYGYLEWLEKYIDHLQIYVNILGDLEGHATKLISTSNTQGIDCVDYINYTDFNEKLKSSYEDFNTYSVKLSLVNNKFNRLMTTYNEAIEYVNTRKTIPIVDVNGNTVNVLTTK